MKNVDVLLWEDNPLTRSLVRVLNKYPDLTLFNQNQVITGFYPDIIVITADDPYTGLKQRLDALSRFPESYVVYLRQRFDSVALSALFLGGYNTLISTDITGAELHKLLIVLGESAAYKLTTNYKSMFLNKQFSRENNTGLTNRELAVIGGIVRAYQPKRLAVLLNMSEVDIQYIISSICEKLNVGRHELTSTAMIMRYGSLLDVVKAKKYIIKVVRKKPNYYVIPKLEIDDTNI